MIVVELIRGPSFQLGSLLRRLFIDSMELLLGENYIYEKIISHLSGSKQTPCQCSLQQVGVVAI
jgi:hypothetical protein